MTVDEAQAAGERLVKSYAVLNEEFCSYFKPQGEPTVISFMVAKGRIVRVDSSNERVTTLKGSKIGHTEEQIIKMYPGQIRAIKHSIGDPGNNLTFVPPDKADSQSRLIFQTSNNRVTSSQSGKVLELSI